MKNGYPLCSTRAEYFIKGTEPKDGDLCKVHIKAKVCTASQYTLFGYKVNLLAGQYCPTEKIVVKVFIQRSIPYTPVAPGVKAPKDVAYELAAGGGEYCSIHGAPVASQTDTAVTTGTTDTTDATDTTSETDDIITPAIN